MSLESNTSKFIQSVEGYAPTAKWDVNAYRLGHGSDTITLPDGSYRKVVKGDTTTREASRIDLERRLKTEFIPKVKKQIGEPQWSNLPENAKVALISLAYNYGSITKKAILNAIKTGDLNKISKAIVDSTYNDNGGILRERREKEANLVSSSWQDIKNGVEVQYKYTKKNWLPVTLIVLGIAGITTTLILVSKNGGFKKLFSK